MLQSLNATFLLMPQMCYVYSFNPTNHLMTVQWFCSQHFSFPMAQANLFRGNKQFSDWQAMLVLYFSTINTTFFSSASPSATCKQTTRVLETGNTIHNLSLTTYSQRTEILLSKASSLIFLTVYNMWQRSWIWQPGGEFLYILNLSESFSFIRYYFHGTFILSLLVCKALALFTVCCSE